MERADIVEVLKGVLERPVLAESVHPVFDSCVAVEPAIIRTAIAEIEQLRRKAGAVSDGESFDEIKRLARAGAPLIDIDRVVDNPPYKMAYTYIDKPSDSE